MEILHKKLNDAARRKLDNEIQKHREAEKVRQWITEMEQIIQGEVEANFKSRQQLERDMKVSPLFKPKNTALLIF